MSTTAPAPTPTRSTWLDYRAVWRWHFYAGLFCIPFVLWLASTGSIYLFRPQIERLLDRPYDHLVLTGPRASADAEVRAALDAVPGSVLHSYQLPRLPNAAPQILVGRGAEEYRVYVHPQTLRILKIQNEDKRPMMVVFHLHGELFMGDRGSYIVELAASWTIVMILTGLYLWWPRHIHGLAGVLYPRLRQGRRILFRDLHAVTGVYVSAFALTLLLTGLPWAKSWGHYLKFLRSAAAGHTVQQDWTTGRSSEIAARLAENHNAMAGMAGMDDMPGMDMGTSQQNPVILSERSESKDPLLSLQQITQRAAALNLVAPVLIDPPKTQGAPWTVRSDTQNRPLRETVTLDPHTGAILSRKGFAQKNLVDRIVAVGTALHEGQLFGLLNQLVELATALGLITLALSAVVLWWRRRATGVLGAPQPNPPRGFSFTLAALVIALGLYLPMMGASLILVLLTERLILRRIPRARHWLGLQPA